MKQKIRVDFYKLKTPALEKLETNHFLNNLDKLSYGENLLEEARGVFLTLLALSEGERISDHQLTKKETSRGIRSMFYIMKSNRPYTSAPMEEHARKKFYVKLSKGFKFIGDIMKKEFEKGNLSKNELYSCLETIGEGGFACAGRWMYVLEQLATGFSERFKNYGVQSPTFTDKLDLKIKELFYNARIIEGNRLAKAFVEEHYPHVHEDSKVHYITFFKRHLNKISNYNIPTTLLEDSFLSSEKKVVAKKAAKFIKDSDLDYAVVKRFIQLFGEQVQKDNQLYNLVLDHSNRFYYRNNLSKQYDDVSHYLSEKVFKGYSTEIQAEAVKEIVSDKKFIHVYSMQVDRKQYYQKNMLKLLRNDEWNELTDFIRELPEQHENPGKEENLLDLQTSDGNTLLNLSIEKSKTQLANLLIEKGADVQFASEKGHSPLITAVNYGDVQMVQFLLDKGADPNFTDKDGRSALMFCTDVEIAQMLLERGALPNISDQFGETPLNNAVMIGSRNLVNVLIEKGADVNFRNVEGQTALMKSINFADRDIAMFLINKGADVNIKDHDSRTALTYAVMEAFYDETDFLLRRGANVDMQDCYGRTSLMYSAIYGNAEIAELLLEHGADVNSQDLEAKTALVHAVESKNVELVKLFLMHGADVSLTRKDGLSPLKIAESTGDSRIVQMISAALSKVNLRASRSNENFMSNKEEIRKTNYEFNL